MTDEVLDGASTDDLLHEAALSSLADEVKQAAKQTTYPIIGLGRVTGYSASAFTVDVTTESGPVTMNYLHSYIPNVDDSVWVADLGSGRWICLGKQAREATDAGQVAFFAMATVPPGWLDLATNTTASRTGQPRLFAAIGTTWGSGDGSTTFNLPPVSGRMLMAKDGSHALGTSGGALSVQMTLAMLIQHTHVQDQHRHGPGQNAIPGPNFNRVGNNFIVDNNAAGNGLNAAGTANGMQVPFTGFATATNQNAGSASPTAIPTVPPYAAMTCAIKT